MIALPFDTSAVAPDVLAHPPAATDSGPHPGGSLRAPASSATTLLCADGRRLAADWVEPACGPAHATALVSPAAGVPRGYYRAFAHWLAGRGYATLTYDYRGIGGSRLAQGVRGDPASMRDWALLDMAAAIAAAQHRRERDHPSRPLPLLLIGHSFGGNAIGFAQGVEQADAILAVGSQSGEWRHWPGLTRPVVAAFFGAWVPAIVKAFGSLPGWALGGGAQPMPAGVARDWSAWGLRRGAHFSDPAIRPHSRFADIVAPVHLWSIEDDWAFAPRSAVDALAVQFRAADVQRHHLHPADAGLRSIGHFGVFRRSAGTATWERLLRPIEAASPALRSRHDPAPLGVEQGSSVATA